MTIRITLTIAAVIFIVTTVAFAQLPQTESVTTASPLADRYVLIQNSHLIRETYLLDRYTGDSWQLAELSPRYAWWKIPKESQEEDIVPKEWTRPAYQIYLSGGTEKRTYMINVITGATWILFDEPTQGRIFWGTIPRQNNRGDRN